MKKETLKEILPVILIVGAILLALAAPGIIRHTKENRMERRLSRVERLLLEGDWDAAFDLATKVFYISEDHQEIYLRSLALGLFAAAEKDLEENYIDSALEYFGYVASDSYLLSDELNELLKKDRLRAGKLAEENRKKEPQKAPEETVPQSSPTPSPAKTGAEYHRMDTKYYSHPEDFYYDHYDDFIDYEDAEEYYYSHGGR